jgi:hypothetical protein
VNFGCWTVFNCVLKIIFATQIKNNKISQLFYNFTSPIMGAKNSVERRLQTDQGQGQEQPELSVEIWAMIAERTGIDGIGMMYACKSTRAGWFAAINSNRIDVDPIKAEYPYTLTLLLPSPKYISWELFLKTHRMAISHSTFQHEWQQIYMHCRNECEKRLGVILMRKFPIYPDMTLILSFANEKFY